MKLKEEMFIPFFFTHDAFIQFFTGFLLQMRGYENCWAIR